jgi:uncharacterized BrkB/YihY/UPF0761 family membrane protein
MIEKAWNAASANPVAFLLICIGLGIVLWTSSRFIPDILSFISEIARILLGEFAKGRPKTAVEKLNLLLIMVFFIVLLLVGLCELLPSALKQALGVELEGAGNHHPGYFLWCLGSLLLISFVSPVWIFIDRHEEEVRALIRRSLRHRRSFS